MIPDEPREEGSSGLCRLCSEARKEVAAVGDPVQPSKVPPAQELVAPVQLHSHPQRTGVNTGERVRETQWDNVAHRMGPWGH